MALKAIIYKASIEVSDIDRNVYGEHSVMIARHPSETDERMLIRLLAFALNVPPDDSEGSLIFAKDMWDSDEPALWQKDLTGTIVHWIEVGQPDEKRMMKAASRAKRASVYSFSASTGVWWNGVRTKLTRAKNLAVWQVPPEQSKALAGLADRSMELNVTVQDGGIWIGNGTQSIEVAPLLLSTEV